MLRKLTGLASALIATTAHASVPLATSENRINGTNTYCFSAAGDKKPIFIGLTLPQGPHRDAYVQYNNGAKIRLKYSNYENITPQGEKFKNYRYVYTEIINKKKTGFYSFYLHGDGLSVFNYVHKKGPKEYFFFPDYGAAKASTPASLCDWSKSDLLTNDEK